MKRILTGVVAQNLLLVMIAFTAIAVAGYLFFYSPKVAEGEITSAGCTVSTSTVKVVGTSVSTVLLATSSNRAHAIIGIKDNATSTVYINMQRGSAAVIGSGLALNVGFASGVSTTPEVVFGRATNLPYTGAVTARTNVGSTTVRVMQCIY